MPELTVAMPAFNSGLYIRQAIDSVLCQADVALELIVVDDGSRDDTDEVVNSYRDPRVRPIRLGKNKGIPHCHNLIIDACRSPFLAHVDSDDFILPGALAKMVRALREDPAVGLAHCHFFDVDALGNTTREAFQERKKRFLATRPAGMDYKRALLVCGNVANHLRSYRREVFDVVGRFDEALKRGSEDYDMALRIADRYRIKLVPEFLYCYRRHQNNSTVPWRTNRTMYFLKRTRVHRRLTRSGKIRFTRLPEYRGPKIILAGFLYAFGLQGLRARSRGAVKSLIRLALDRVVFPAGSTLYRQAVRLFSWWPISSPGYGRKEPAAGGEKRIAYYLWQYPVLSQTFIQRETTALRRLEPRLEIFADAVEDIGLLDESARALSGGTRYLLPIKKKSLAAAVRHFVLRRPLAFLNMLLYVLFHTYRSSKYLREDLLVFLKAVYLARRLQERGAACVHAPWADVNAFVALVSSRLAGIPFSLQARAHDIHRRDCLEGISDKLMNARLIITNTRYNTSYLRSLLPPSRQGIVRMIYNGLDLEQFNPGAGKKEPSDKTGILCVARLIEQKGLVELLGACRALLERGYLFQCDIIGGTEEPLYTHYYVALKKLYRRMGLEGCVSFLGPRPFAEVLEHYRKADMFVLPCVMALDGSRDIIPNALIEAMAMKLPVISTNITGVPEIVDDGLNGLLVPPHDGQTLLRAMVTLIEDAGLRQRLGEEARRKVEERFDIRKNIVRYRDAFREITEG